MIRPVFTILSTSLKIHKLRADYQKFRGILTLYRSFTTPSSVRGRVPINAGLFEFLDIGSPFYRFRRQYSSKTTAHYFGSTASSGKGLAPLRPYTELGVRADRIITAGTTELAGAGVPTCRAGARTRREAAFRNPGNARLRQDAIG